MSRIAKYKKAIRGNERGATAIFVAVVLVAMVGMVALAVDIGYVAVTKNELQNIADAAALTATRQLGEIYISMTPSEQATYDISTAHSVENSKTDLTIIFEAAQSVVGPGKNTAGGKDIQIRANQDDTLTDIYVNTWDPVTKQVFKNHSFNAPNAVRVVARRDNTDNSPISTFFAKVLGIDTVNVSADATAALSALGTAEKDIVPIGISSAFFMNPTGFCDEDIIFYPTTDSCAGWHAFGDTNPATGDITGTISNLLDGSFTTEKSIGDTIYFTGATGSAGTSGVFEWFELLFESSGYDIKSDGSAIVDANGDPVVDASLYPELEDQLVGIYEKDTEGNYVLDKKTGEKIQLTWDSDISPSVTNEELKWEHNWETRVIVYEDPADSWDSVDGTADCVNPNEKLLIKGYAKVLITQVIAAPDKIIKAKIDCGYTEGRGGGENYYGAVGTIPGLVE